MPFQSEKQRRYMHANLPDIAKRWERDYSNGGIAELNQELNSLPEYYLPKNQGGRIGFDTGTNYKTRKELIEEADLDEDKTLLDFLSEKTRVGSDKYNIKLSPEAEISLSKFSEGDVDVNLKNITYGADTTANIGPIEIGMDYKKFLDKYDVTEEGTTVEKDTNRDRSIAYMLGLNLEDLYAKIQSDKDFENFYFTISKTFGGPKEMNQGGVVPAHEAGIYGLAEGGQLVQPGPGRPGYGGPHETEAAGKASTASSAGGGGEYRGGETYMAPVDVTSTYTTPEVTTADPDGRTQALINISQQKKKDIYEGADDFEEKLAIDREIAEKRYARDKYLSKQQRKNLEVGLGYRDIKPKSSFGSFIKNAALAIIPGLLPAKLAAGWKVGKGVYDYQQGKYDQYLPDAFKSTGKFSMDIGNTITRYTTEEKLRAETKKLQQALPKNHPESIALEAQTKTRTSPKVHEGEGVNIKYTSEQITDTNDAKADIAQLEQKYEEMNEASRLAWLRQQQMNRAKQEAYLRNFRNTYVMASQGGRIPGGYNTGGLSNLFRLKNV